ncbi:MAG TPA: excinuclease ABC subunit UvrC [Acidimicrobiales bacterium]|nr:excinuclease ABC subunit UvrC [Acidimicrobiales bacterium]
MLQRPPAGTIPDAPGSYQFRDRDGRVIYVGKAASLRSRLSNYFVNPAHLPPRTAQMVASAESVEWIQVRNDVEALMLEYSLIKQYKPRFNVRLRDDKSYPFLAVTLGDEWPRAMVRRGARDKGSRYFGPYAHAYAIRDTLDSLLRTFPIRTCSDNKFRVHQRQGRPCLLFHIEKCSGPCIEAVDHRPYDQMVSELIDFLDGDTQPVIRRLEQEMAEAAGGLEFERAARLRDRLVAVRKAVEKQQMVTEKAEDLDCFGLVEDELEAAIQVFYVRRGRVVGRKGFIVDKVEDLTTGQLVAQVVEQHYDDPALGVPPLVLVPALPDDAPILEDWLAVQRSADPEDQADDQAEGDEAGEKRERAPRPRRSAVGDVEWWAANARYRVERSVNPAARAGIHVQLRVPQRGDKKALLDTVTNNAKEEFTRHRMKRASDHNARARALNALQDALDLPEAPLRIECYDMSHLQGTDYVGSMVVMEDGIPRPTEYRRFKVRTVDSNDDFASMEEVLTRRLKAYLEERGKPVDDRRRRFAYPPQLLLVDGGKGQLGVAMRVLEELGLDEEIPVAALAKQFEEVYVPGRADPVRIPRGSEALYLLQQIRDEAHRFAITYHRNLRNKRMTSSVLDDIPGLGPTRKRRLVRELGGVNAVKQASLDTLRGLSWLPDQVALAVYGKIHGVEPAPAPAGVSANGAEPTANGAEPTANGAKPTTGES